MRLWDGENGGGGDVPQSMLLQPSLQLFASLPTSLSQASHPPPLTSPTATNLHPPQPTSTDLNQPPPPTSTSTNLHQPQPTSTSLNQPQPTSTTNLHQPQHPTSPPPHHNASLILSPSTPSNTSPLSLIPIQQSTPYARTTENGRPCGSQWIAWMGTGLRKCYEAASYYW